MYNVSFPFTCGVVVASSRNFASSHLQASLLISEFLLLGTVEGYASRDPSCGQHHQYDQDIVLHVGWLGAVGSR
uniref:Uncharacterized protein n=1 Tax=Anguilla anguilla TaxID=7936 RepID=A0A0E9QYT8_ANGAN